MPSRLIAVTAAFCAFLLVAAAPSVDPARCLSDGDAASRASICTEIIEFLATLELTPENRKGIAGYRTARGRAYAELERYDSALIDFSYAIDLYPTAETFVLRGAIFEFTHQSMRARIDCEEAIRMEPDFAMEACGERLKILPTPEGPGP